MNLSLYLQLFFSFLQVGMFSIGGGYAALPLIQDQVVNRHDWLSISEFSDLITIAEMTPGPIAVNSATFVGIRIAGFPGALVATFGCICPSLILVSLLAHLYFKYREMKTLQHILECLRPVIVALIASACLSILRSVAAESALSIGDFNLVGILLFAAAFLALRKSKLSPILVMILCGCANLLIHVAGNELL
ncbi:MAG: chromate transporter [Candidatus Gastranaerophilales bacterium]|nr:chromate transporter [Candidatus Gastranaerophilales bacterium]